ncbi:sensor domain CHASE3-containing protein [Mariprofundus aestuarium]|uniref:Sensor domain CHASE3-containing protein n=1 Tax=Mariprofundus aestuarium TaxID=1921086 RepID=A0A2K8L438_MARES|nr:sensor domain CHASE3-containing protein [Mariprofundus aestuarium]
MIPDTRRPWLKASAPFLLVLAIGLVSSVSMILIKEKNEWVHHTDQVIEQAGLIAKLIVDMETSERGFLLTGEERFLEPYNLADNKIDNAIGYLSELVADNPPQVEQAQKIGRLINQWKEQAAIPEINKRREVDVTGGSMARLQAMLVERTGKKILDRIRVRADLLDQVFKRDGLTEGRLLLLQVTKAMVDMETGERGFLITGQDEFLEPYDSGREMLVKYFDQLTSYCRRQSQEALPHVEAMFQDASQWQIMAGTPEINARKKMNEKLVELGEVINMVKADTGKSIMDQIRVELAAFEDVERRLRVGRIQEVSAITYFGLLYTLISAIVAALLGYWFLQRKNWLGGDR